ncbi:MAG TPA: hypothetical protein VNJ08_14825 [Bacteriovoracaceae bacterium]|nr:hypothetical protein [Bacteriovoracaceae bacterium]
MDNASGLVKMPVTHLIKFADTFVGIEVHIFLNGRFVKLNYSDDQFIEILRKLQQKDLEDVYLQAADCKKVTDRIQESMSSKTFYDPKTTSEQRIESTEAAMKVVKQVITHLGPDTDTVKLLTTINNRAMSVLSESPTLFAFIKRYKKNCSEEFLRTTLTSYLMSLIIDKFTWKTDVLKEKGALASILCDMMLEKEDFKIIREYEKNGGELPERLRQHPIEVAESLRQKRNLIPSETLTIIELHHELPDGRGFPRNITATRFNHLACIFILSQKFIEELFEANFDFDKRLEIIQRLQKKYSSKSFEKSMDALIAVVDT